MGLDISSKSSHTYHASYGGLHQIRFLAYKSMGGLLDFSTWHHQQAEGGSEYDRTLEKFPNLLWHSDCDGAYTRRGKVASFEDPKGLQTGSSVGLLKELELIKDTLNLQRPKDSWTDNQSYTANLFYMLYDVVKDVVENYDGRIEFC